MKTILVIGATGAQGGAIVKYLSSTGDYHIVALTRSTTSSQASKLAALPNVELVLSQVQTGYDTEVFITAAKSAEYVLVNTDGFAIGELAETFWGIRLFELAARAGVKHFIYSGLDSNGKKSGYDPKLYVGHYEGKARVQEWIHAQKDSQMAWTIIRSGPYMELLSAIMTPSKESDGTMVFQLPLDDGSIPFIHLGDFGRYVDWALSNPSQSTDLDFGIATAHISGEEIAEAFSQYTGKAAKYVSIPMQAWNDAAWKSLPNGPSTKVGFQTYKDENLLGMSYGDNFANWWNLYKASAKNQGLIQRDYAFLDKILPDRVKSLGEWMDKVKYTGEKEDVLNLQATTE